MKNVFWRTGLAVVVCLCGLLFAPAHTTNGQTTTYSFHQIAAGFSPAMDINDDGTAVGFLGGSDGYIWTVANGIQPITTDSTEVSKFPHYTGINNYLGPLRINAAGTIAGVGCPQGCGTSDTKAAIWTPTDGLAFLGSFDNNLQTSAATGLNGLGQVVGFSWGGGYNNSGPFLWSEAHGLEHLTGFDGINGYATGINTDGLVVGTKGGIRSVAFVWSAAAGQTDIPDVPGATHSVGFAVNDTGVVVGRYLEADQLTARVFRWSAALGTEDIDAPPGYPELMDINNSGHVVTTIIQNGRRVPYIYRDGIWTNLNQLLPTGTAFTLQFVTAINNNGWIVGAGTTDPNGSELLQGFVLIPPDIEPPPEEPPSFEFEGFASPVAAPPSVNLVKAGAGVPVKFSLGGDHGLDVFSPGYPASQPMTCSAGPSGTVEETSTAGQSGLSYDPETGLYTYLWKTEKSWARTCRQLVLAFQDGSSHVAYFHFDK